MPSALTHPPKFEVKDAATQDQYIFVLQLHDGRYVIGQAANPCKRIAAINSGHNRAIPKSLQVNRVIGIKPIDEHRNLPGVVNIWADKVGVERVVAV
jgi:hypothetical protein